MADNKLRVLICMDGSRWAHNAFDWYVQHVHQPGNAVVLFHCVEFHEVLTLNVVGRAAIDDQIIQEVKAKAEKYAQDLKEKLRHAKIEGKIIHYHGIPRTEILKVATEEKVDLIITGTRGLGTVKRTLLGSVSDHVLHHSHVPVIICSHVDDHRERKQLQKKCTVPK